MKEIWVEGKDVTQLVVFALAVIAALWALARLRTLIELAKTLKGSQQSAFDLRVAAYTLEQLKDFMPSLKEAASNIHKLNELVPTLKEQVPLLNEGLTQRRSKLPKFNAAKPTCTAATDRSR